MRIIVINGPNLNMLGKRDPAHYGSLTLESIELLMKKEFPEHDFEFFQSNIEGEIINEIQKAANGFDAIIINPGGYSHTSVAIKDALEISPLPKIEVHLSKLSSREEYRQVLITAQSCNGYISGFKEIGYLSAVYILEKMAEFSK